MWIEHRDTVHPEVYFAEHETDWGNIFGSVAGIVANNMSDGLLVSFEYHPSQYTG
jgi:hypothetical protein